MKHAVMMLLVAGMFFSTLANATQVIVDLDKLPPEQAAAVMQAKQVAEGKLASDVPDPKKVEEWVTVGEKIGQAMGGACKELSIEVNDFVKTPVGQLTAILIIWKIVGEDLWSIVGGSLAWVVIMGVILWSFHYFHMLEKIKSDNGTVSYVRRYDFDERAPCEILSVVAHAAAFLIFTIVCLSIVFG